MRKETVAQKMMRDMGWKEGEGLGKDGQGLKTAIKPSKKLDTKGIGAVNSNTNWIAQSCSYDAILAKLNIAYSGDSPVNTVSDSDAKPQKKRKRSDDGEPKLKKYDGETKEERKARRAQKRARKEAKRAKKANENVEPEEADEEEAEAAPRPRHLIYAKRLKAKQVSNYSGVDKDEIMGGAMRHEAPRLSSSFVASYVDDDDEDEQQEQVPNNAKITYDGGFTEDTQVSIYNQAMDNQIKGRVGLGLGKKMSKSQRREAALMDATLLKNGSYLARKFIYAGRLDEFTIRREKADFDPHQADTMMMDKVHETLKRRQKKSKGLRRSKCTAV